MSPKSCLEFSTAAIGKPVQFIKPTAPRMGLKPCSAVA